jgi:hypothetical protein
MRNPIIVFFSISFILTSANAQLGKGSILIGGSAYLSGDGMISNSFRYNLGVQPSAGFFLVSKLALGTSFGFYSQGQKINGNQIFSSSGVGLSPFARYYMLKEEKKVNLFAQLGLGFSQGWSRNNGNTSSSFYLSPNASVGLVYFMRPQIALEARLNADQKFVSSVWKEKGIQLNLSFGFQIHLNKTEKLAK